MPSLAPAHDPSWSYAEQFLPEDDVLAQARRQAELLGATPPSAGAGATLRILAAAMSARSVVEVGTGTGTSGLWLLRGMHPDGVLTSVDYAPEQQQIAREVFAAAGFAGGRVRLISGYPTSVLPRLADGGYDLVFLDILSTAGPDELTTYLEEALRLLRPGGVLVIDKVFSQAGFADPNATGANSLAVRQLCEQVREDERLLPGLIAAGDGLLCAVKV